MNNSLWNKRIPTLLGVFLILIGIGVTSFLVQTGVLFETKASPGETPLEVRITNISDTSLSISYKTTVKTTGVITYDINSSLTTTQTALDDRDQKTGTPGLYFDHHITIKNMKPSTQYFFSITSGKDTYLNNDILFQVTTAPVLDEKPISQKPITGKIISPDGKPIEGAIIYLTIPDAQTLSTTTKSDGSYILPLTTVRTTNLNSYFTVSSDKVIQMMVIGNSLTSSITVLSSQTDPIPIITLSQNYDFTQSTQPTATTSASFNFPAYTATLSTTTEPSIQRPIKDESFTDQRPQFRGTALPNEDVVITIHSEEEIKTQVKTDSLGNWSYRPPTPLLPGSHTISISTRDKFGILKTITQSFTVYASGTQVEQSATPSATPKLTITPSVTVPVTPTLTPTSFPTSTPPVTITLTPTPTLIVAITPTASVDQVVTQSPKGGPPQSPGSVSIVNIGIIGFITTGIGLLLFLLSRGTIS